MNDQTLARRAGRARGRASLLAIAGFTVLGSVFEYRRSSRSRPRTSSPSTARTRVRLWLGRLVGGNLGRWITITGVAAATVQVVGLQRWVTLVPGISQDALDASLRAAAEDRFELYHLVLGKIVGETIGYALTATFTVLVVTGLRGRLLPGWLAVTGYLAAALIATGVVIPLVEVASLTNFAGYVVWCAWLLVVAGLLLRRPRVSGAAAGR